MVTIEEMEEFTGKAFECLSPLFGIEGRLEAKVFTMKSEEWEDEEKAPEVYDFFLNGRRIDSGYIDKKDVLDPYNVGLMVGCALYPMANPTVDNEGRILVRQQIKEKGFQALRSHPDDEEHNHAEAYVRLSKILQYCSGFVFADYMESKKPQDRSFEEELEDTIKNQQPSGDDAADRVADCWNRQNDYIREVAAKMYGLDGISIIPKLAHLSFEDAQSFIMDQTGFDLVNSYDVDFL